MLVNLILTLCSIANPAACMQVQPFDPMSASECMLSQPGAARWLAENHPGYQLAGWKCAAGRPPEHA